MFGFDGDALYVLVKTAQNHTQNKSPEQHPKQHPAPQ